MEISSFQDLMTFAERVNGGETGLCATLTADIEAEGDAWLAIGSTDAPYRGVFDGGGHVIRGLDNSAFVDLDAETLLAEDDLSATPQNVGLFAKIGETGTVKDLGLEDGSLTVKFESMGHAGSVAGSNLGIIENCWNSCTIVGDNFLSYAGGIAGVNNGRILSCRNFGDVTVSDESCAAAGIACTNYGIVQFCYNTGNITATGDGSGVGGIVEYNSTSRRTLLLLDCYNTGAVTATGKNVSAAGIVCSADGTVARCWNSGKVSATGDGASCGGIARATISDDSVVKDCYNNKDASGVEALCSSAHGTVDNVLDLTDAQFRQQEEFAGFEFGEGKAWTYTDGCYPRLSAFPICTLTYDGNGNTSGTAPAGNSWQRGNPAAAQPGDLEKTDCVFTGWNTAKDGSGTPYKADDLLTLTADTTLYAQWTGQSSHSGGGSSPASNPVTVPASSAAAGGTVTSSAANARAGDKVTLTPVPEEGYELIDVTVTDKNGKEVPVTKNADGTYSFTMPATAVTITPVFEKAGDAEGADTPVSGDVSDRFTDVSKTAWYHDPVQWAVDKGIMNGVSEDRFAPDGTATRAMVVTMVWRLAGEPAASEPSGFSDVSDGAWYADAVAWAAESGAVNGTSADTFSPNTPVTREQLASILYRYAQAQGKGFEGTWMFPLDYPDAAEVSDWADEAMHWMVMHGVITGMGDGTLAPKDNATRAQIATMLLRFCEELEE